MDQQEIFEKELKAQVGMRATGFIGVDEADAHQALKNQSLGGSTRLYDAILLGNLMIFQTVKTLKELDSLSTFEIVHIVITDGQDNASDASLQEVKEVMDTVSQISILQTHIIDIETNNNALKQIARAGGDNCQYHYVDSSGIQQIFDKITVGLAIRQQTRIAAIGNEDVGAIFVKKEINPELFIKVNRFCVLLTVDTSYSMEGYKYNSLLKSVQQLQNQLSSTDFISCIKFDKDLSKVNVEKIQQKQIQYYNDNSSNNKRQEKQNSYTKDEDCCCTIF